MELDRVMRSLKTIIARLPVFINCVILAIFMVSILAGPVAGQDSSVLKRGETLYLQGKLDAARSALLSAVENLSNDILKSKAHLYLGMVALAGGQKEEAEEQFRWAVSLHPQNKLSAREFPPNVVQLYDQARAMTLGAVSVQTNPSDAEVYIDGALVGLTPVQVGDLLAGKHLIRIVKPDYKIEEREITVRESERSEFYLDLDVLDEQPALIVHKPLQTAIEGRSVRIKAKVTDNKDVTKVTLHYRVGKSGDFLTTEMEQVQKSIFEGVIAREVVSVKGLNYYITATDIGNNVTNDGDIGNPFIVRITELDKEPPRVFHEPLVSTSDATKLKLTANVKDNKKLTSVKAYYKKDTDKSFIEEVMKDKGGSGEYEINIPDVFLSARNIHYYIEAIDASGNISKSGRADAPHSIIVDQVLPFKHGFIVERKKDSDGDLTREVLVNVGARKGYKKDQVFTVFDASEEIIDPETGMVLAVNQKKTGKIRITIPGPASSRAKITREEGKFAIRAGNLIRLRTSAPKGVGGYSAKYRENTVTWSMSPEPEVKGYLVYRSETPEGPFEEMAKVKGREMVEVIDKGNRKNRLVDGKRYYYRVRAFNDEKLESDSSETGFVVAKGGPNPPTLLKAFPGEIRHIPLTWTRSDDEEAKGYKIFRSEEEKGTYKEIAELRSSETHKYIDKPEPKLGHEVADAKVYWYRLVSFNKAGKFGNPTEPVSAQTRAKPAPPSGLSVVSSGVRTVSLNWGMSPEAEIEKYRIYRSLTSDGKYELIKEIRDRTVTEFSDQDKSGEKIEDGKVYFYRMTALNSGGAESELSPAVFGSTFGPPKPPLKVRAASGLVKQVMVTWEPPSDPEITGYKIYRGDTTDKLVEIKSIRDAGIVSFMDTGKWGARLEDGADYYYTVRSFNSVNVKSPEPGAPVTATTKPVPMAPTGLSASQLQAGKTTITWSANPERDIDSYRVIRSEESGSKFKSIATSVKTTSYTDTGLKNGSIYYYKIQALDKDGLLGEQSSPVSSRTKPAPVKPIGVFADASANSVSLSWEKNPEPDIQKYVIYVVGFFGKEKAGESKQNSHKVTKLNSGTAYTFVVSAMDKDGLMSAPSGPVTITTTK